MLRRLIPSVALSGLVVAAACAPPQPFVWASRLGKPEEVAALVKFLMSSEAAYITRQVISVNGGLC